MSDENAVERIQEMEEILDRANKVIDEIGSKISELEALQPDIQKLEKYYTGKEWKADFRYRNNYRCCYRKWMDGKQTVRNISMDQYDGYIDCDESLQKL